MNPVKKFLIGATVVFALIACFIALCHEMKKFALRVYEREEAYAAPIFNAGLITLLAAHLYIFYQCTVAAASDAQGGVVWLLGFPLVVFIDAVAFAVLKAIWKTHDRAAEIIFLVLFGFVFFWAIGYVTSPHVNSANHEICEKIYVALNGKTPWEAGQKR